MKRSQHCPEAAVLASLLDDRGAAGERAYLEEHLARCDTCRLRLEELASGRLVVPSARQLAQSPPRSEKLEAAIRRIRSPHTVTSPADTVVIESDLSFLAPCNEQGFLGCIGPYRIEKLIGQGGMGMVLKAHDPILNRTVAIKVLHPAWAAKEKAKERFLREARSAAAVINEYVVTIHAVEMHGDLAYLVMEFIEGQSLQQRIEAGPIDLQQLCQIGSEVAQGLAAAHAQNLIHRDIKPANILLASATGRAKITDFGLARAADDIRLTRAGMVAGTPQYMSPEQAAGKKVDARSDLFSLGVVLYLASTGEHPFRSETLLDTLRCVREQTPAPLRQLNPELPKWFTALVEHLLEKDPDKRIQSARQVADALAAASQGVSQSNRSRAVFRAAAIMLVLLLSSVSAIAAKVWWPPATAQPVAVAAMDPLRQGFRIAESEQWFASLEEAVTAADSGNVIEIAGDGPFVTQPLEISGKALTIRAAPGSHPLLLHDPPGRASDQPLLVTDADLHLEGIEVQWKIEAAGDVFAAESLPRRSVIVSTGAWCSLRSCRIVAGRANACLSVAGQSVEVQNSHLISEGVAVFWEAPADAHMEIRNNVIESRCAFRVWPLESEQDSTPPKLVVQRNTIAATAVWALVLEPQMRGPLKIVAERNVFDAEQLCQLTASYRLPRSLQFAPTRALRALRMALDWSERENIYARRLNFLSLAVLSRPVSIPVDDFQSLDRWQEVWHQSGSGSVEAELEFMTRSDVSALSPLQLAAVTAPSGAVPDQAGAIVEQVGPGAAARANRLPPRSPR